MIPFGPVVKRGLVLAIAVFAGGIGYSIWDKDEPARAVPAAPPPPSDCNAILFEGLHFTECIAVPGRHRIETKITGSDGLIYRGFSSLSRDLGADGVAFAVNGGMYDLGSQPIGYYVENGHRLTRLNRRTASGNFYMKPNGVFFGDAAGNWQVMTSDDFIAKITKRPEFGTQSGPMLLIKGQLHPQISPVGTSLKLRNAIGVDKVGRAHFVISDEPVSFGALARLMRDHARTDDALFLDGTVSALWHPASGRMDARYPLGPLIVISTARKSAP